MEDAFDPKDGFERYYMNSIQLIANVIDPNVLIAEWGRATGKTEGVMGPRIIKVGSFSPVTSLLFYLFQEGWPLRERPISLLLTGVLCLCLSIWAYTGAKYLDVLKKP